MQRIFDPFAESTRNEDGTIIYNLEDNELRDFKLDDEETLRAKFEHMK